MPKSTLIGIILLCLIARPCLSRSEPGARSLLSAHNCYPYHGVWADRIDRALATGYPLSIELDLCWAEIEGESSRRSVIAHDGPFRGSEPDMSTYFFERVRRDVEASIRRAESDSGERDRWPMIVLDLDIKHGSLEHARAIRDELSRYRSWLTTAERSESIEKKGNLEVGPILVILTGTANQRRVFHDELEIDDDLIAFGRARVHSLDTHALSSAEAAKLRATCPPADLVDEPANNFRRWWNNSWAVVEAGGATRAGEWTEAENERLHALVEHAHAQGYFIRFYTINGHNAADAALWGMSGGYNTGSLRAARVRWKAQIEAGVDLIATDQYEQFSTLRDEIE